MPSNNLKTGFYRNNAREHSFTADRVYHSGEIIQVLGRVGIVEGERQAQIGDEVKVCFDVTADVQKLDPNLAFAVDAAVGYNDSSNVASPMTAVAGGGGDFDIGVVAKPSASGEPFVRVIFPFGL